MKFLETVKGKVSKHRPIKLLLHEHLSGWEKPRSFATVHASEVTKKDREFCGREYALRDLLHVTRKDEFVGTAQRLTWDFGNAIQAMIVNRLADMGRAVGHWDCRLCGKRTWLSRRPERCLDCRAALFKYVEPRFVSAYSGISCGIDTLVYTGHQKLRILEIKSVLKAEFEKLVAPEAEHRIRTQLYLRIVEESDDPGSEQIDTDEASVLYVCKGGYTKDTEIKAMGLSDSPYSPFKEFSVQADPAVLQKRVQRAAELKVYRDKAGPIPTPICPTSHCSRARACNVAKACFSGAY